MMAKQWFKGFDQRFFAILAVAFSGAVACTTMQQDKSVVRAEISSKEVKDGSIALLTVTLAEGPDGKATAPEGEFEDIRIPFFPAFEKGPGVFQAVFGVPHSHAPGSAEVVVKVAGSKVAEIPFFIIDGGYRSETLQVTDERKVKPNQKDMLRIMKEQAVLREVYDRVTPQRYWKGPFSLPMKSAITSPFGTKRVYNGEHKSSHLGLDLRAKIGTPIYSAAPGEVVVARNLFFTGRTVIIDHGYGVMTLYAHMNRIRVKVGQKVNQKQFLGLSGATGRVSGPHLHWMAIVQKMKVNPSDLVTLFR